ncbi:MAG: DUF2723 domain-containing protein [Candidatus Aureabacteria bacterium]|nr:DUF2723 domain-containing protein [Candidatus Auribacterota bacterium]
MNIPPPAECGTAIRRPFPVSLALLLGSFVVYQTTFACTPRLFVFPKVGLSFSDTQEHAAALKGRPNATDMRKHLLYYPVGCFVYRIADQARIVLGISRGAGALIFPNALYGSLSTALAYLLFLRLMRQRREAAVAAAVYAFTYSVWLVSSITESYALTTMCVNVFFWAALRENARPSSRWCCGMIILTGLSGLWT